MPVKFDESQLEEWVAEAEAGYDVGELKRRGNGRPGKCAEASQGLSRSEPTSQAIARSIVTPAAATQSD